MKRALVVSAILLAAIVADVHSSIYARVAEGAPVRAAAPAIDKSQACGLHGKVKIVTSFPDYKIKIVNSFPDAKVKKVTSFPDSAGEWMIVDSSPDFTVQIVDSFPDFTVQYVDSFPGCP